MLNLVLGSLEVFDGGILWYHFIGGSFQCLKELLVDLLLVYRNLLAFLGSSFCTITGSASGIMSSSLLLYFCNDCGVVVYCDVVGGQMGKYCWVLNLSLVNEEICSIGFVIFCTFSVEEDITEEQWVVLNIVTSEIQHPGDVIQLSHKHGVATFAHLCSDVLEFALDALPSIFIIEHPHLLLWHWRPLCSPDLINQRTSSHELNAFFIKVLLSNPITLRWDLIFIHSNHRSFWHIVLDPFKILLVSSFHLLHLPSFIQFFLCCKIVSAISPHQRFVLRDDTETI